MVTANIAEHCAE